MHYIFFVQKIVILVGKWTKNNIKSLIMDQNRKKQHYLRTKTGYSLDNCWAYSKKCLRFNSNYESRHAKLCVRQNATLNILCFDCLQLLGLYLSILWFFFGMVFHKMLARLIQRSCYFILYLCNVFLVLVVWFLDLETQEKYHVIKGLTVARNKDSWYLFW